MGEELEQRHHLVLDVSIEEGDVEHFLNGMRDEEAASVLCGLDTVLIFKAGVPKYLEILLLPWFGLSREQCIIFVEGTVTFIK